MVVVEKEVNILGFCLHDMVSDFCEFCYAVLMLVPVGSSVDADVADVFAHDGFGEIWRINTDEEYFVLLCPVFYFWCEEFRVSEFDCEFVVGKFVDEVFDCVYVGEFWW